MQDLVKLVLAELRSAWRYRWHALGVAWAVCALGWLAVYLTPDQYEARSRFYVDTSSALGAVRSQPVRRDGCGPAGRPREASHRGARGAAEGGARDRPRHQGDHAHRTRGAAREPAGAHHGHRRHTVPCESARARPQLPDYLSGYGPAARGEGRADHARHLHRGHAEEAPIGLPDRPRLPRAADRAAGAAARGGRTETGGVQAPQHRAPADRGRAATSTACRSK